MAERIRPIFDEETPLKDVPEWWRRHVEHKVIRGAFKPCWIWDGAVDNCGHPRRYYTNEEGKRVVSNLRHEIVQLFWKIDGRFTVSNACQIRTCVNPAHLIIRELDNG